MAKKKDIRSEAKETAVIIEDALRSISARIGDIFSEALDETGSVAEAMAKEVQSSMNSLAKVSKDLADSYAKAAEGAYKQADLQKTINNRKAKQFAIEAKIEAIARSATKTDAEKLELTNKLNAELAEAVGYNKELEGSLEKQVDKSKRINKAMGFTGGILKGLEKAASAIGLDNLGDVFADAKSEALKMSQTVEKGTEGNISMAGKLKVAFAGVGSALGGIASALMDPLFILGLIIKSVKFLVGIFDHVNKLTNKIGQSVGLAGAEAKNLKAQIHAVGDLSGDMYYNTEEMFNSYSKLNEAVGQNLAFNKENAKTYADMTMYLGYSESSAAELYKMSVRSGQNYGTISTQVKDEVNALNEAHGIRLDQNQVMDQIVNASNSIKYNQKGSTQGLVEAAHAAARLGMSMDDIAAAAETHLDFESSIAKEIEAEMFLQKDLNLDKLRYAALTGDTAMAAREEERLIKENYKSLKGNVMAQQAFAAATGISMENLSGAMLKQEELQGLTGKELKDKISSDKKTEEMAKKAVAFDRVMMDLVLQIKGILEPLANVVGPVLLGIAKSLGPMLKAVATFAKSGPGKILLGLAGAAVGLKIASGVLGKIKSFFGFGSNKPTGTPMDPIYTVGGSGGGDMMSNVLGKLGKRGLFGGKISKNISKVFGGMNSFIGKQMRNLSSMFLKRSSMTNQLVKNSNFLSKIFPKMSTLNSKLPQAMAQQIGKTLQVDKLGNITKMANPLKTASTASKAPGFFSKAKNLIPKSATSALSKAGPLLTKTLKVLGPVGVAADLVMGGASGHSQSQMSAEEQKAAGVEEGISATKATTLGVLTGGAEKGSMFSESLGIEKGSAGDEAMGIAGAAGRGALTGAALTAWLGPGAAIGAAVGGVIGGVAESFKVFSNPDSSLRKWTSNAIDDVGNFAKKAGGKIYDFAAGGLKAYTGFYANAGKKFLNFASSSAETLGGWASSAGEKISGWASSAGETISGWASSAGETMSGWASSSMDAISGWASSAGEGISSFFGNVSNGVSSLASGAADLASEAGAYLSDVGSSIANSSVGKAVSSSYDSVMESDYNPINWFAEGGVVTKPMIGGVGEAGPEAIIPLSQAGNMLGGGEVTKLLKELISEVRKGGNVYLDGNKVGYALALQSSKMG